MSMPHVDTTVLVPRIPRARAASRLLLVCLFRSVESVECGGLPAVRDGAGARVTLRVAD